jgi:hypothetical protein
MAYSQQLAKRLRTIVPGCHCTDRENRSRAACTEAGDLAAQAARETDPVGPLAGERLTVPHVTSRKSPYLQEATPSPTGFSRFRIR